jgi:endonuclease/exonuclease/phosphatase family metal-dependent hydrolase
MRLVSYNILDGGEGRADPLAEVIIAQRPDVVALIEADHDAVVDRIADRLEMEWVGAAGKRHAIALLSRWPIIESINHGLLREEISGCLLEVTVAERAGREWVMGLAHLHPRAKDEDDRRRQTEIAAICEIFSRHRDAGRAHLLAGDFNSDSPIQEIDIQACNPQTQKAWKDNGGRLPRGAIEKLQAAGYVDSFAALHAQAARKTGSFSTQYPGQRVDYIFGFGLEGRFKSAWIEQDRLAKYASDHFPVGAEVE